MFEKAAKGDLQRKGAPNPAQIELLNTYIHSLNNHYVVVNWCRGVLDEPDTMKEERGQFEEMLARNIVELAPVLNQLLSALAHVIELDEGLVEKIVNLLSRLQTPLLSDERNEVVDQLQGLVNQLKKFVGGPSPRR